MAGLLEHIAIKICEGNQSAKNVVLSTTIKLKDHILKKAKKG